jgi:predicted patatin/cPLA2 family phospholipase
MDGVLESPRILGESAGASPSSPAKRSVVASQEMGTSSFTERSEVSAQPTQVKQTALSNLISNAHDLRRRVLSEGTPFHSLNIQGSHNEECPTEEGIPSSQLANAPILSHDVVQLLVQRFREKSIPGHRPEHDTAKLALCIEGGGMRGAVSAGMTASIAALGLSDAFDEVYGSSAGAVVGSYFVTRQMCLDVYVDILPAAQGKFVCTKRMLSTLAGSALDYFVDRLKKRTLGKFNWQTDFIDEKPEHSSESIERNTEAWRLGTDWWSSWRGSSDTDSGRESATSGDQDLSHEASSRWSTTPGMNISFVLENIMGAKQGVRPLDIEHLRHNAKLQPMKIVASYVTSSGQIRSKAFGVDGVQLPGEGDPSKRHLPSFFDCLRASMTVPGATSSPVMIEDYSGFRKGGRGSKRPFFDAFCVEPLPYRSAVAEGATHCLVLCSRPADYVPTTTPRFYENVVTPIYFKSHGEPKVASFFKRGGQQYIYAEDLLTLEEGKQAGIASLRDGDGRVTVPPPVALYGVDRDSDPEIAKLADNRDQWKRAHLLPLQVPAGTPELKTLEQDRVAVLEAVRGGFAAGFDLLAPALGVKSKLNHMSGYDVARLLFPDDCLYDDTSILNEQLHVSGEPIVDPSIFTPHSASLTPSLPNRTDSDHILQVLPGFAKGKLSHLAEGLRYSSLRIPSGAGIN